jgi:hypothetical protein
MSYLNLELQARERVADRLRLAERERLASAATDSATSARTPTSVIAAAVAFARLLGSVL